MHYHMESERRELLVLKAFTFSDTDYRLALIHLSGNLAIM